MAEKLEIPWETKYKFAVGGYHAAITGFLSLISEEFGADATYKLYERFCKENDRIKHLVEIIQNVFKIDGNDLDAVGKWWDIFYELYGTEAQDLEQSTTLTRNKITKCPWKIEGKGIDDWCMIFSDIVYETINPKATIEKVKGMCNGDSYCEFVSKLKT